MGDTPGWSGGSVILASGEQCREGGGGSAARRGGGPSPSGMSLSESSPSLDLGGSSELLPLWGEGAPHSSSQGQPHLGSPSPAAGQAPRWGGQFGCSAGSSLGLLPCKGPVGPFAWPSWLLLLGDALLPPPAGSWATKWPLLNSDRLG